RSLLRSMGVRRGLPGPACARRVGRRLRRHAGRDRADAGRPAQLRDRDRRAGRDRRRVAPDSSRAPRAPPPVPSAARRPADRLRARSGARPLGALGHRQAGWAVAPRAFQCAPRHRSAAAAAGVAKESSPQAVRALGEALREDAFWGVRAACARALGSLRTDAARDALVAALAAEEHARARRAVARALGEFRGDLAAAAAAPATAPAAAALERLARAGDPSYYVEAGTVLALCRTPAPHAPEVAPASPQRPPPLL